MSKVINDNAYELELPESFGNVHRVINIEHLKPYHPETREVSVPPIATESDDPTLVDQPKQLDLVVEELETSKPEVPTVTYPQIISHKYDSRSGDLMFLLQKDSNSNPVWLKSQVVKDQFKHEQRAYWKATRNQRF